MTNKQYIRFADILALQYAEAKTKAEKRVVTKIIDQITAYFIIENDRFDKEKFLSDVYRELN